MPIDLLADNKQDEQLVDLLADDQSTLASPRQSQQEGFASPDKWRRSQSLISVNPTRILQDVLAGATQFGQGIHNAPYYIQKAQENIGLAPRGTAETLMPQPTNIDWSKEYGVSDPGFLDKMLQGAVQYAPHMMAAGLAGLGSIGTGALGGTTGGFTQAEHPISGAVIGGGLGAAGGAIPAAISGIKSLKATPKSLDVLNEKAGSLGEDVSDLSSAAENQKNILLDQLSGGTREKPSTLTDNREAFVKSVKDSFDTNRDTISQGYDDLLSRNKIGDADIYGEQRTAFDLYEKAQRNIKAAHYTGKQISDEDFTNLENYLQKYSGAELPPPLSLRDAIKQKNEINSKISGYYWGRQLKPLDAQQLDELQSLEAQHNKINDDIQSHFQATDPDIADEYAYLGEQWREKIFPFKDSTVIQKMISGATEDVSGLGAIFRNPNASDKTILNRLEDEGRDRVLYDVLGRVAPSKNIDTLHNAIKGLDEKGLLKTVSSDSSDMINQFKDIMRQKTLKENNLSDINAQQKILEDAIKNRKSAKLLKYGIGAGGIGAGLGSAYELFKIFSK